MKRIALLALALLTALSLAGPAAAKKKPHKHGKRAEHAKAMPKGWAKHNKAKGGAAGDPDDDDLSNWGEFRSHTKPMKADTDRDGIGDAEEDYDRDGLDNGSEVAAGTDPGVKDSDRDGIGDGAEDADGDGLSNAAEDRIGSDPRESDSDGDGIADGEENAGVVQAFDGQTLTVALAAGGMLTGAVDEDTYVECDVEAGYDDEEDLDEEDGAAIQAFLAEEGDEEDLTDEEWTDDEGDDGCVAALVPGTPVHEAELDEGVFVALALVLSDL
jgi:hypothetical protein